MGEYDLSVRSENTIKNAIGEYDERTRFDNTIRKYDRRIRLENTI